MHLPVKLIPHLYRRLGNSAVLLPLIAVVAILAALLIEPTGTAALETLFQSPADTPTTTATSAPTNTPVPSPSATQTGVPSPTSTPQTTDTAEPQPTDTPPPPTPMPSSTAQSTSTPADTPTAEFIQMPLLPSTATPEVTSAVEPQEDANASLPAGLVSWIVVLLLLALAAFGGFRLGNVLRDRLSRS